MELSARVGFIKLVTRVLVLGLVFGPIASAQAGAKLELDRADFDFGLAPVNCTLVYQTWPRSTGKDTLEIADIKTGCSCLSVPLEKNRLAPGDSVELTFQWHVGPIVGKVERAPYLFSNDNSGPHRLSLRTDLVLPESRTSSVYCRPQKISFDAGDRRKDNRRVFTIQNDTDRDQALSLATYTEDAFYLELPDTVAAGSPATGIVILQSGLTDSAFEGSFTLEFRGIDETVSRVSVAVSRGDFSFRPAVTTSMNTPDDENIKR